MAFGWGTILSLGAQLLGQGLSATNNQQQQRARDGESARQQAHYTGLANEDPLARSEAQAAMGQYNREAEHQAEVAKNTAAITGATPEYELAVKKAQMEGMAQLQGSLAAGASARRDYYTQRAEDVMHQKAADDQAALAARQQTFGNLVSNAGKTFGAMMDSYGTKAPQAAPVVPSAPATKTDSGGQLTTGLPKPPVVTDAQYVPDASQYIPNADGTFTGPHGLTYMKNYSLDKGISYTPVFK